MSLISGVPFLTMLGAPVSIPLIECPVVTEDLANRRREVLRIERKPDIAPLRASRFAELVHTSDEGRRQFNGLCMRRQANAVVPRPRPHETGQLQFFGAHAHLADAGAFAAFLAPLRRKRWFVYTKRPFAGPKAVLAYLSRYTHRVAISNRRLIALDDRRVSASGGAKRRSIWPATKSSTAGPVPRYDAKFNFVPPASERTP